MGGAVTPPRLPQVRDLIDEKAHHRQAAWLRAVQQIDDDSTQEAWEKVRAHVRMPARRPSPRHKLPSQNQPSSRPRRLLRPPSQVLNYLGDGKMQQARIDAVRNQRGVPSQ